MNKSKLMMTEEEMKICREAQDLYGKVSVSYIMRKMNSTAAEAEDILLEWNKKNMITKFKCKKCNQTKIENWFDKETRDNFICNECQNVGDIMILKGSNACIALDAVPSKGCDEYHKRAKIQINFPETVGKEI